MEVTTLKKTNQLTLLLVTLIISILLMVYSFNNLDVFWYFYTFTLLLGIALASSTEEIMNQLTTKRFLLIGLSLGIIGYIFIAFIYKILPNISQSAFENTTELLDTYSPTTLWQYILLIVIIVFGEEMLWRVYILQMLKKFIPISWSIFFSACHFSLALLICGFYTGAIAALLSSILFGLIYERLKSFPLLFTIHLTMVLLLFLLLPLN